jgi:hypothetical protein
MEISTLVHFCYFKYLLTISHLAVQRGTILEISSQGKIVVLSRHLLGGTEENHKLTQDIYCPAKGLNKHLLKSSPEVSKL